MNPFRTTAESAVPPAPGYVNIAYSPPVVKNKGIVIPVTVWQEISILFILPGSVRHHYKAVIECIVMEKSSWITSPRSISEGDLLSPGPVPCFR